MDLLVRAATTSTSTIAKTTSTSSATGTAGAASSTASRPPVYHAVGIILAVCSGLFIGTSFVLKKRGLLKANVKYNEEAGEGYGYLKNAWWWSGMTLMIVGEICNFVAYAFVDAILVTPLGALSVVVTTVLSAIFLKERLSFVGKVGCFLTIVGTVVIVLNSPAQSSAANIQEMQNYVISPGFLVYGGVVISGCTFVALWAGPRYGKKSMLVYLSVCSLIGGLSVVATQGLGAAIVTQIAGTPQFNSWFIYILLVFVICTLVTEIIYLNKALNIFNAALVTPTYYVYFTSATIVTSAILFRGFKGSPIQITTIILGFLVICSGVVLLQLSKSAKNVPDAAVFTGDLDQVRTVAEQEEYQSEPKADAIRGAAGLLRSFSKSHIRREAEEARRIHDERMEPIGENEQVEWDGLRRRKTILAPGQSPVPRARAPHPPLGMSHFPDANEPEHDEDDILPGLFPALRARAQSVLHSHSTGTQRSTASSVGSPGSRKGPHAQHTVAMSDISPASSQRTAISRSTTASTTFHDLTPTPYRPTVDHLHPKLRHMPPRLSSLQNQDTAYRPSVQWAPSPVHETDGATPGPTPPPHARAAAKRQFSFQNVFSRGGAGGGRNASLLSGDGETQQHQRPASSGSARTFGVRRSQLAATEEERLGLVKGDSPVVGPGVHGGTFSPAGEERDEEVEVEKGGLEVRRGAWKGYGDDFDDGPGTDSGSDLGEYARVMRRESDDDGGSGGGGGEAFV